MSKTKIKLIPSGARQILRGSEVHDLIQDGTEAIRDACNAESSWGGYEYEVVTDGERTVGRVWSTSNNLESDHNRHQRMIRYLDAGA